MIWGKSKIRVILVSVSVQIHFGIDFLSGDKDVLSLVYGGHLSPEKFYALFLGRKGQVHLLFLKAPSTQNSQCAKVSYLGGGMS